MTKARSLASAANSAVNSTELGYLDGVTSAIQTQLNAKASLSGSETLSNKTLSAPTLLGTTLTSLGSFTNYLGVNPTRIAIVTTYGAISSATVMTVTGNASDPTVNGTYVVSSVIQNAYSSFPGVNLASGNFNNLVDGTITLYSSSEATVTATEIAYLDGVTSAIQTQLNGKKAETNSAISANQTLAAGYRYFVDTSAARTLTLPASPSVGDEIQVFDATNTAATYNITLGSNSLKINGTVQDAELDTNGAAVALVYTGSTYGWRLG